MEKNQLYHKRRIHTKDSLWGTIVAGTAGILTLVAIAKVHSNKSQNLDKLALKDTIVNVSNNTIKDSSYVNVSNANYTDTSNYKFDDWKYNKSSK